ATDATEFLKGMRRVMNRLGNIPQPKSPAEARYERELHSASEALYNDIFGPPPRASKVPSDEEKKAILAETAFNKFLLRSKTSVLEEGRALSLFVRLIPSKPELLLTPIGLLELNFLTTTLSVGNQ